MLISYIVSIVLEVCALLLFLLTCSFSDYSHKFTCRQIWEDRS